MRSVFSNLLRRNIGPGAVMHPMHAAATGWFTGQGLWRMRMFNCIRHLFLAIYAVACAAHAQATVERWHPLDLTFTATNAYANPFLNVTITGTFAGPDGTTIQVPGFYAGGSTWKIRFAPIKIGTWTFSTSSNDAKLTGQSGSVNCIANTNPSVHGKLMVDPAYPHHFKYEDSSRYFLMGFECDWLGMVDQPDATCTKAKQLIDMYAAHNYNNVILDAYAYDTNWWSGVKDSWDWGPSPIYCWQGTYASPDQSRMNENFWSHFDTIMEYLFQKGIHATLMFRVYNKSVRWPANKSANDDLYFRYITSRYQAYPNVIWCFSKEAYNESDNAYQKNRIDSIKGIDGYHRLVTNHDAMSFIAAYPTAIDFMAHQDHDGMGQYKTACARELSNHPGWPYWNAESEYERSSVDGTAPYSGTSADQNCKAYVEIMAAGGYATHYYSCHSWDEIRTGEDPGASVDRMKAATGLFRMTKWYQCTPNDGLVTSGQCLANQGKEYIVYLPNAGSTTLTINSFSTSLSGRWVNVNTGATQMVPAVTSGGAQTFACPWSGVQALLWLSNDNTTSIAGNGLHNKNNRGDVVTNRTGGVSSRLTILNIQGKIVGSFKGQGKPLSETRGLPTGVYFVRQELIGNWLFRGQVGVTYR
jgi:hypothetical protein